MEEDGFPPHKQMQFAKEQTKRRGRPGQVVKLSTSGRRSALAAGRRGWCVFGVLLCGWDIEEKSVLNC